ncbi:hypothetical protein [Streptomyces sp. NPDC059894]|uniref:hypothetical protein n=1 Tax=unclassified Streptomyces TaxID=2593676 RepID=UPI00364DA946
MAISFGHDRPWGGVSQHEYRRMAQHPGHPLAYRVHFAAIGWADRQGQAGFDPGRLAALLGKEGKPLSGQSTRNAVARARKLDLVSPRSGPPASCFRLICSRRARLRRSPADSLKTGSYMLGV